MSAPSGRGTQLTDTPMSIAGVLETCLYASDLDAAERFYVGLLGLELFAREPRRHVFMRCGAGMLLVFDPARTATEPGEVGHVAVPAHGTHGAGHVCFRIEQESLAAWRTRRRNRGRDRLAARRSVDLRARPRRQQRRARAGAHLGFEDLIGCLRRVDFQRSRTNVRSSDDGAPSAANASGPGAMVTASVDPDAQASNPLRASMAGVRRSMPITRVR